MCFCGIYSATAYVNTEIREQWVLNRIMKGVLFLPVVLNLVRINILLILYMERENLEVSWIFSTCFNTIYFGKPNFLFKFQISTKITISYTIFAQWLLHIFYNSSLKEDGWSTVYMSDPPKKITIFFLTLSYWFSKHLKLRIVIIFDISFRACEY